MAKNPNRREPFFRFCAPDWRSDVPLRRCSYAARGLWIDMISLMHEAHPYGELRDAGKPLVAGDLVQLLGGTQAEVKRLLAELEDKGVFSRRDDGAIYSRRMTRDYLKTQKDQENGKRGGNPTLRNSDNHSLKPPDNPTAAHPVNPPDKARGRTGAPGHFHIQKEEDSVLRTAPSAAPDRKAELWRNGLDTLERLTGKPTAVARKLLGKLLDAAHADHDRLLALIQRAEIEQPSEPYAWLMAGARAASGHEVGLFEPDPWGLRAWIRSEPDAVESTTDGGARTVLGIAGYDVEAVGTAIAEIAKLNPAWAGSWAPLAVWLREGIPSDSILAAVRNRVEWEGYTLPHSLAYFDKPVRDARARTKP